MPRPIIIDTDPGQDDAVAIMLALASDELEILGITCVAGNVPLELTATNARKICEISGRPDMRVFAGAAAPLERELVTAEHVHGATGLDGPDLPAPTMPLQEQHAVDFIVETARARKITLCPIGPLTNIALALKADPSIVQNIDEIVLMGGGFFEGGNITAAGEFNIYVDPEAAAIVFASGIPITAMPLDVTHTVLTTPARLDAIRAIGTPAAIAMADLLKFYERFDVEKYGELGGPLHDPNVIAYLINPTLYSGRHINVEIETGSTLTRGMTVADWWGTSDRAPNVTWIRKADDEGFYKILIERIARL